MKTCTRCKHEKPLSAFYRKEARCIDCRRAYNKEWMRRNHGEWNRAWERAHPARHREWQKAYRAANRERTRVTDRNNDLKKYGLTIERFGALLFAQKGGCAACDGPANGKGKTFHVDHDHRTGAVRGLLCHSCNTALGLLKEDPARLQKLIDYIIRCRYRRFEVIK